MILICIDFPAGGAGCKKDDTVMDFHYSDTRGPRLLIPRSNLILSRREGLKR